MLNMKMKIVNIYECYGLCQLHRWVDVTDMTAGRMGGGAVGRVPVKRSDPSNVSLGALLRVFNEPKILEQLTKITRPFLASGCLSLTSGWLLLAISWAKTCNG